MDNASTDSSGLGLARAFPSIPLLQQSQNMGYAGGNNAGIRFALGQGAEYVLIINNDVVVEPGFLESLLSVGTRLVNVGVSTGLVYYQEQDHRIFSAAGSFSYLLCTGVNKGSRIAPSRRASKECLTKFACGVLMLVRREVFETVGLFDESFFMYFEDVEFSRRVLKHFNIAFTPSAVAYHKSGGGTKMRDYTPLYLYYHTRNRIWTFRKDVALYRLYVIGFTMLNVVFKSIVLATNVVSDRKRAAEQITALWKGLRDGVTSKPSLDRARTLRIQGPVQ